MWGLGQQKRRQEEAREEMKGRGEKKGDRRRDSRKVVVIVVPELTSVALVLPWLCSLQSISHSKEHLPLSTPHQMIVLPHWNLPPLLGHLLTPKPGSPRTIQNYLFEFPLENLEKMHYQESFLSLLYSPEVLSQYLSRQNTGMCASGDDSGWEWKYKGAIGMVVVMVDAGGESNDIRRHPAFVLFF